jgi:hypothetical protein
MKKTDLYNNLPKELIDKTKLRPGEIVSYKLVGIGANPMDPSRMAIPSLRNVPSIDQIWEPSTETYVDIAPVKSVDPSGKHIFHKIYFYGVSGGILVLHGGRAVDQEIHSYLSLCNYNKSNQGRDTSKEAIFELVDEAVKSETERRSRNIKREALNAAADLNPEDVRDYIASMGLDDTGKIDVLRNKLEEMADKTPQQFMELINNKQAIMKASVNRAISKGVILFNAEQSRFMWPNGEVILTVSRTTGGNNVDELVSYCVSNAKGEKVYNTINAKGKK